MRLAATFLFSVSFLRAQVVISQIYGGGGNAGATLRNDFIELFNRGAAPVDLAGWTVQYAAATGNAWQTTALRGSIAPGRYYLVQQAAGAGGTVALPAPDAAGEIAMSATAGKVAVLRGAEIVDLAGYGAADMAEGAPARALSNTTAALRRRGGCTDSNDNLADFEIAAPNPRNSASAANDCSAGPAPARPLAISAIQGAGTESPVAGERVETVGVVTARRSNGFYIQSRAGDEDNDPATSEGLLVFTGSAPPAEAARGNLVRVRGLVAEFRPASDPASPGLTELINPEVELMGSEQTLPEPVEIDTASLFPAAGPDALERFEGMRVRARSLLVIAPSGGTLDEANDRATDNGVFYAVLASTPRPFRRAGADIAPERLRIDSGGLDPSLRRAARTGAEVSEICGVLDYGFRTYTVLAETLTMSAALEAPWPADVVVAAGEGEFAMATMNLRRLFDDRDDPSTADVIVNADALRRRLDRIAAVIRDSLHSPAVIAVEEVENLGVLEMLAVRLGPRYRTFLEEGNDPGGIDVGFLVDTGRITVDRVTQEGKTATYRTPAGTEATLHDRPPLVLVARAGDFAFRAVAVHLRSLLNSETPEVQAKRRAQAAAVRDLAARLLRESPSQGLVVLGDFNAFPDDETLTTVAAAGLRDLATTVPRDQGYTFIQDGVAQTLDHILISDAFRARWSRFEVAHGNADWPDSAGRYSDHDVPMATFLLNPQTAEITAAGVTNSATFLTGAIAPGQWLSLFTRAQGQRNIVAGPASGRRARVSLGSASVEMPIATASPGVFAAIRSGGEFVDVIVNGLADDEPAVWVGGRKVEVVYRVPFLVRVRAPQGGEVIVVSAGQSSQPGVRVE